MFTLTSVLYFYSYIAKTESMNRDLEYIIEKKLSNRGSPKEMNSRRNSEENLEGMDWKLPLVSKLKDPEGWIKKVHSVYGEDMEMFGYSYRIINGQVYAGCKHYTSDGICI